MEIKHLKEEIDKLGKDVISDLIKQLLSADKKATGQLINSLKYEVLQTVDQVLLKIYASDYFENVDKGRRPGAKQPPIKAIIPWVEIKGIRIKNSSVESTAFVIARSIGIKGIPALNMKQKVINNIIKTRTELLQKAFEQDIKENLDQIIKNIK